jgi:SulP family sulfate permease
MLDRLDERPRAYVINMAEVPMLDSTGAATIEAFARKVARRGAGLYIAGARPPIRRALLSHGVRPPLAHFRANMAEAIDAARADKPAEEDA